MLTNKNRDPGKCLCFEGVMFAGLEMGVATFCVIIYVTTAMAFPVLLKNPVDFYRIS